jgi:hypothetical protein
VHFTTFLINKIMANTFQIKRRTSNTSAPGSLLAGELAYNEAGDVLYYGNSNGTVKKIGGSGAFVTYDTTQTVTGAKTFTGSVDLGSSAVTTQQTRTDSSTSVANTAFVQDVASLLDGGSF